MANNDPDLSSITNDVEYIERLRGLCEQFERQCRDGRRVYQNYLDQLNRRSIHADHTAILVNVENFTLQFEGTAGHQQVDDTWAALRQMAHDNGWDGKPVPSPQPGDVIAASDAVN
jgi:hypothetical protein